jgi:RNA 2',3'-cyclic 3'-phosphodiesterase
LDLFRISTFVFRILSPMPRCFVAIPLPEEVKDRLVAVQPPVAPGVRILGRDKIHLTLHFLDEIDPQEFEAARNALSLVKAAAFTITIRGVGRFPPRGRPTVLWAGIEDSPALVALHASVGRALKSAIGFQPERRRYSPHITLARLNPPARPEDIERHLRERKDFQVPPVLVDRFALFSSVLMKDGPRYSEEAAFPFTAPDGMRDQG